MTDKTASDKPEERDLPAEHGRDTAPDIALPAAEATGATASAGKVVGNRSPLITAIEIENFKGIGAPVRIELRPITLLFGRNSAGKSTILQALCYAHEILSHRNIDAYKTELGGDQIDLGGFRQFVHGHDLDRTVRLRFELNLDGWRVPEPLLEKMTHPKYLEEREDANDLRDWVEANDPAKLARSGWVELAITAVRSGEEPMLASYEVGINESLVGRIRRSDETDSSRMTLTFNWTHPLFRELRDDRAPVHPAMASARETPDFKSDEWRLAYAGLHGGSKSPLPNWDDLLHPDASDLAYNDDLSLDVERWESTIAVLFQALVSGVLVGIGRTLRDELARLRNIGPLRELRQRTGDSSDPHRRGHWNDGSAAWDLLLHRDQLDDFWDGDLLKEVNDWLAREDRLDSGYKLRRRSTAQLPADVSPVSRIRRHEQLFAKYRNQEGVVDVDKFIRDKKPIFVKRLGFRPDQAEKKIREGFELELVGIVEQLEKGNPSSDVKALVRAVAEAEVQRTLQLVTAEKELQVRTSDIGVGISQILPVVVAALDPDRPGITAVEQPELHVHPKMQVELGDLFAAALGRPVSGFAAFSDQPDPPAGIFLIETHSEHLILRLLRRIEETYSGELQEGEPALKPDQLSVVFLEQIDGEVTAKRLRVDETGEFIDRWPQGFFRERAAELF